MHNTDPLPQTTRTPCLSTPMMVPAVCSVLVLLIIEGVALNFVLWRRDSVTVGTDDDGPALRLGVVALCAAALVAASPASAQTLYVQAGRLIDGLTDEVRTGQCITLEGERIKAVAPCGKPPDGATIVDWSAFTVLPGLIGARRAIEPAP